MFKPATREVVAIVGTSLCACGLGIMGGWIANTRKRKTTSEQNVNPKMQYSQKKLN